MNAHEGWFKFHRQIFDNPVCTKDAEYFFVWVWILNEANYEEQRVLFKNKEIILQKGQLLTTVGKISSELKINHSKVVRILKTLEIEKQIEKRTSNQNTLITVINWEKYQSCEKPDENPVKNGWKTDEKRMKNERKTDDKPSYYKEELKKERNKEGKNARKGNEPVVYYPNDEKLNQAFTDFAEMRKTIKKPMTDRAVTLAMNKLQSLSTLPPSASMDNDLAIKILEQSTMNCWQGLFPLKTETRRNGNRDIVNEWRDA